VTDQRRGGILNPAGIERIVNRATPFHRIRENLRAGHLQAVTMSTTHVGTGRTVVFVEQGPDGPRFVSSDPTVVSVPAELRAEHALASAAIPMVFPSVRIGDEFYADGGLRQNVPLAPALRLGAEALIVISPRYVDPSPPRVVQAAEDLDYPGPFYLLGKALNALLLDHVENDLIQLERINRVLDAGARRYGDGFVDAINRELGVLPGHSRMRPVRTVLISASQDIGRMAADYVRSPRFSRRVTGIVGRGLRRIAEASGEADLLSYLLFDGGFATELIELGRKDARARHDELCALIGNVIEARAAA
jgi:NTE family protein